MAFYANFPILAWADQQAAPTQEKRYETTEHAKDQNQGEGPQPTPNTNQQRRETKPTHAPRGAQNQSAIRTNETAATTDTKRVLFCALYFYIMSAFYLLFYNLYNIYLIFNYIILII